MAVTRLLQYGLLRSPKTTGILFFRNFIPNQLSCLILTLKSLLNKFLAILLTKANFKLDLLRLLAWIFADLLTPLV